MNEEEYMDTCFQLKRASRGGRPYFYWFCPKGEDGEPVFYVDKKEGSVMRMGKQAIKTAKEKKRAYGTVSTNAQHDLIFINNGGLPSQKIHKIFKTRLATRRELKKVAPLLKKAVINDA